MSSRSGEAGSGSRRQYSKIRLPRFGAEPLVLAAASCHEIVRTGRPASICWRSSLEPARMSNGSFSCSYSYGGCRHWNFAGFCARISTSTATRGLDAAERVAIEHMYLAAAARLLRVLLKRRLEDDRPEVHARQIVRTRVSRRALRHRPTARQSARTAASCLDPPTRSCPRTAPCPDRRPRCRPSACSETASPTAGRCLRSTSPRRQSSIGTTVRSAPMPHASLKNRASSAIVIP